MNNMWKVAGGVFVVVLAIYILMLSSTESIPSCTSTLDQPRVQGQLIQNDQGPADGITATYPTPNKQIGIYERTRLLDTIQNTTYWREDVLFVQDINISVQERTVTSNSDGCFEISTEDVQDPFLCIEGFRQNTNYCFNMTGNESTIRFEHLPQSGGWFTNNF